MKQNFFSKLKEISIADIGHVFVFLIAFIPAMIYKRFRPHMWLVCEHKSEASDNGYWFFKYLCEEHPEVDSVYAINPKCSDASKVSSLGNTVSFGTLKHWIYYLAAEVNISSQKGGKPNAAVCYFLEVYGILKNKRVFLQHGITKDDVLYCHYENAKFALFITNVLREQEYVSENFNYPGDEVVMCGMPRLDELYRRSSLSQENLANKPIRTILIMPTWRSWISPPSHARSEIDRNNLSNTPYYKAWNGLLNDGDFAEILEKNNLTAVFYLHREMQKYEDLFYTNNSRIRLADSSRDNVQELLIESDYMITDYSSVAMDFAYMNKPLCYYQFDYDEFRSKHYAEGYFSYKNDGFGPICSNSRQVYDSLRAALSNDSSLEEYARRRDEFFTLRDDKNCERTYEAICNIL